MSVYVAGAWIRRRELQKVMDDLETNHGIKINSHWPGRGDGSNSPENLSVCGANDLKEISESDVLMAIMDEPDYAYRGTFTEIGYSLGLEKRVIIVCPGVVKYEGDRAMGFSHYCQTLVFYWHPNITHVKTLEEAIKILSPL